MRVILAWVALSLQLNFLAIQGVETEIKVSDEDGVKVDENEEEGSETGQRGNQEAGFIPELILGTPTADLFNPCPGHATGLAGEAFSDLINTLVLSQCLLAAPCTYPHDVGSDCRSTTVFDFIVVGGGTSGAVIAARLSEVESWNVLLLEAGGNPPLTSEVPRFYLTLQRTDLDWDYPTAREQGLFNGLMGRVNRWPRGKALGGTSTMGAMLYIRGNRRDFDNIAAAGNLGWAFSDVLPYYKKSEDMRDYLILASPLTVHYHARGGPLTLSRFGQNDPMIRAIQKACLELGYPPNFDINGVNFAGFASPNQGTLRGGERLNTAKAFLNPARRRKNLFVIKRAFVSRILICPSNMRAYAVEYYYRNEHAPRILRASREIILSAGVIGSAKILMHSGIGPRNDLESVRIATLKNLRVGRNLQDHVTYPGLPITLNSGIPKRTPLDVLDHSYEYLTRRTGPLATIGVTELVGFLNVDNDDSPDLMMQFIYIPMGETDDLTDYLKAINIEEDLTLQYCAMNANQDLLIPLPTLLHPVSRGKIRLKTNETEDYPEIIAGYLNDPNDLENLMIGVRFIERFVKTETMTAMNASLEYLEFPGCCGLEAGSDYYYACAISHLATTGHNQLGTAKMGPATDPDAVVDSQLRVYGVKGLRVADASILPRSLTSSLLASVVMIGEKVSDIIKLCWLPNYQPWSTTKSPYRTTPPTTTVQNGRKFYALKPTNLPPPLVQNV